MQTIHRSTPAMLQIKMKVQENTRPYSCTSGCVCISDRIVKQAWKHQVNPTANIQAQGAGNGEPGCVKCITPLTTRASSTTTIVQNGRK